MPCRGPRGGDETARIYQAAVSKKLCQFYARSPRQDQRKDHYYSYVGCAVGRIIGLALRAMSANDLKRTCRRRAAIAGSAEAPADIIAGLG